MKKNMMLVALLLICNAAYAEVEKEKKQKPQLPRIEKTLAAALLTVGFCWTVKQLYHEHKIDHNTSTYKGDNYRRFTDEARNALAFVAAGYLTLRCGYYTLKSARKLLFKST